MVDVEDRYLQALTAVFALGSAFLLLQYWDKPLGWDASIYYAMGKFLFTGGEIGIWESFRPPGLPAVFGALWKLGVPPQGWTRLITALASTAGIAGIYQMTKTLADRKTGLITAATLAGSALYLRYTVRPLTGLPAALLVFTSLYLVARNRYGYAGLVAGTAFLIRFPSALLGVPAGLALILYEKEDLQETVKGLGKLGAGFAALALPFLAASQIVYGSFAEPFIRSMAIPAANEPIYQYGLYYLKQASFSNPLLLASVPGIFLMWRKKDLRPFAAGLGVFYGFFSLFPHKIPRYTVLFLPLMAVSSGVALRKGLSIVEDRRAFLGVVGAALLVFLGGLFTVAGNSGFSDQRAEFYGAHGEFSGTVAGNDPSVLVHGDMTYYPLGPGKLDSNYGEAVNESDYFSFNSCAWYCVPGNEGCEQKIDEFTEKVEDRHKKLLELNDSRCSYSVYEVEK